MRILIVLCQIVTFLIAATPSFSQDGPREETIVDYDTAVRLALENSFKILMSNEDIAASGRQVKDAKRAYYPKVRAQASYRDDILDFQGPSSDNTIYGLILDWSPYQSGELLRRNAEAKLNYYMATLNREQAFIDVVLGVREEYYNILKSQDDMETEKFSLKIEKQKLEGKKAEFEAGLIKGSDITAANSAYYETELGFAKKNQAHGIKLIRLGNMLQKKDISRVADADRIPMNEITFTLENGIKTAYLRQREYLKQKGQENLARMGVKYAKLKRLPKLSFFTTSDYAIDQSTSNDEFGFRIGLTASYPLYDAGETKSLIESAKSYFRRANLSVRNERENTTLRVTESFYALGSQIKLLKITREREKRFIDDWKRAQIDFENGAISQLDYDKFKLAWLQSNNRIRGLELDVMLTEANMLSAIGIDSFDELVQ